MWNTIRATGDYPVRHRILPLARNSDDFISTIKCLSQVIYKGYRVGEISCPHEVLPEASSINFRRSVVYGWA